jgi:hypothetical protein
MLTDAEVNSPNRWKLQVIIFDASLPSNQGTVNYIESHYNSTIIIFTTPPGALGLTNFTISVPLMLSISFPFMYEKSLRPSISRVSPSSGPLRSTTSIRVFVMVNKKTHLSVLKLIFGITVQTSLKYETKIRADCMFTFTGRDFPRTLRKLCL